jgi:hypothetical protein
VLVTLVALVFATTSAGKPVAGCPSGGGWGQVEVEDGDVSGAPSVDGNNDGETCIMALPNHPFGPDVFVVRDNNVQGP